MPEWRYGGQAAIDYINAHGGVNGRQIHPVFCYVDGSPEASINCANEFVDDHVALAFFGVDVSSDSALPILKGAGIPFVAAVAGGSAQESDPDAFLFGANGPDSAAAVRSLKDAGVKTITVADYGGLGAGAQAVYDIIKEVAPKVGMQARELQVPFANADWASLIASALANGSTGFALVLREDDCTKALQALKAASFTGVTDPIPCSQYLTALGNKAPVTVGAVTTWAPNLQQYAPAAMRTRLQTFIGAMQAIGQQSLVDTEGATRTFSAWMELAEILGGIKGPVNAGSVKAALQGASNVPGYLGPNLHCGKDVWPSEPAVCSAQELLLRIEPGPNGPKRVPVGNGFTELSNLAS